jgi:hypothetical protein
MQSYLRFLVAWGGNTTEPPARAQDTFICVIFYFSLDVRTIPAQKPQINCQRISAHASEFGTKQLVRSWAAVLFCPVVKVADATLAWAEPTLWVTGWIIWISWWPVSQLVHGTFDCACLLEFGYMHTGMFVERQDGCAW